MEARGQTGGGPQETAELPPKGGRKLGPTVRHHVHRKAMDAEDVMGDQLCGFLGGWELLKGNEVGHLRESIHHGKDGCVSIGGG